VVNMAEENKEINKEILKKIDATNERLNAMIQLLEIVAKVNKRKTYLARTKKIIELLTSQVGIM